MSSELLVAVALSLFLHVGTAVAAAFYREKLHESLAIAPDSRPGEAFADSERGGSSLPR